MPRFLLSWHGTILCHDTTRLFLALPAMAATGYALPVLLDETNDLVEGPSSLTVIPNVAHDFIDAIGLGSGGSFLTAIPDDTLRLSEACDRWEQFLPVSLDMLPALDALTSRSWMDREGHVARGRLAEFTLALGERRLALDGFEAAPDGTFHHTTTNLFLRPWPDEKVGCALSAVLVALQIGKTDRETIWAQLPELARQITLVLAEPNQSGHLYYLARLCTLVGLFSEAHLCLEALAGAVNEADRLWARSIVAKSAEDEEAAILLLSKAFTLGARATLDDDAIEHGVARIFSRDDTHRNFMGILGKIRGVSFTDAFDLALVPGKLSPHASHETKAAYYEALEVNWCACPQAGRSAFIARETRLNGVSHSLRLIQGHASWLDGEVAEANAHYDAARILAVQNGFEFMHFNCGAYSWLTDTPRPPEPHALSVAAWQWHWASLPETPPEICLVAGCDATYFRFVPKLLASLIQAAENAEPPAFFHLVLGIADPNDEQVVFLKACSAALIEKNLNVRISFACGPLSYPDGASFSCIRYLILPEIAKRHACSVLTLDIDAMIPRDFSSLVRTLKADYDYGFRLYAFDREGRQFFGEPWGFGAGVSYFGEPDRLPQIAQALHDYIVTAYRTSNTTNWCVDQCALSGVYHRYIAPRWNTLRMRFMDDDPAIIVMPHHVSMDKQAFGAWDGIVDMAPVYSALGIDPELAGRLGKPA